MAIKSCELDLIPTTLFKRLFTWIIAIITDMINESITTGIFPVEWKIAIIRTLLKKLSLTLIHSNYRAVSNLPFLSKVVEKVVLDQFGHTVLTIDRFQTIRVHTVQITAVKQHFLR